MTKEFVVIESIHGPWYHLVRRVKYMFDCGSFFLVSQQTGRVCAGSMIVSDRAREEMMKWL